MADDTGSVAEVRTFLIADVRGYSRFTDQEGNVAAARLAERFEALAREVVAAGGGRVLDIRGDEVAAEFGSPSVALRTAMELQQRFAAVLREDSSSLPLWVGVGVDVGEAVSVGEGYRGGALNRAARLCSLAKPGEVLLTESVVHLAGPIAGAAYASRGRVRVKGIAEPLSVRQLVFDIEIPKRPSGSRRRRRWVWVSAVALALAVGTTMAAIALSSRGGDSGVVVAANSVAAIDPHSDRVVADVAVGATPTEIAAGAGYVWVLNANNETISRIDPRTREAAGPAFSVAATPTALAAGDGALWVMVGHENAVLRVDPTTERRQGAPIPVAGRGSGYPPLVGMSFGAGQVYVVSSGGSIGRLDPAAHKVVVHVPGPGTGGLGTFLAADPRGVWVAGTAGIDHLDPRRLSLVDQVPGPQFPNGVAIGAGWAWVTDASGNSVWKINPALGRLDRTFPVGARPSAVTFGAGAVWVATTDGAVTRLDPDTGATKTINVGGAPASLTIADGLVWVTVA